VIPPETLSIRQAAHTTSDPVVGREGSQRSVAGSPTSTGARFSGVDRRSRGEDHAALERTRVVDRLRRPAAVVGKCHVPATLE
jgi:hypothetical protein